MKFKQIEYVVKVAKYNSFSRAAKELYVTQPNISSTIASLENEIGFKIFERTNQGVILTEKGSIFLEHANNILAESKKIYDIQNLELSKNITIASMFNHTFLTEAFISLCSHYQKNPNIYFSLLNGSYKEILDKLFNRKIDLGILFMNQFVLDQYVKNIESLNLEFQYLNSMHLNINLRKNHPLLKKEPFNFEKLSDYPYVNYGFNPLTDTNILSTFHNAPVWILNNPTRVINVTERETRKKLVIESDAYSIGVAFHPKTEFKDDMVSIPIPGIDMVFAIIKRKDKINTEEINFFVDSLMNELFKITI